MPPVSSSPYPQPPDRPLKTLLIILTLTLLYPHPTHTKCIQYHPTQVPHIQSTQFDLKQYFKCQLCYDEQQKLFEACSAINCTRQEPSGISGIGYRCGQFRYEQLDKVECRRLCCEGSVVDCYMDAKRVKQRQQFINAVFSVLQVVIALAVICYAIYLYICQSQYPKKENKTPHKNHLNLTQPDRQQASLSHASSSQISDSIASINKDDSCSICLSNGTDTLTPCGHTYHLACLVLWMRYKMQCPLCRSVGIWWVRVYCRKCYRQFVEVDLRGNGAMAGGMLARKQCQVCGKLIYGGYG